jgi:hypothetical protein
VTGAPWFLGGKGVRGVLGQSGGGHSGYGVRSVPPNSGSSRVAGLSPAEYTPASRPPRRTSTSGARSLAQATASSTSSKAASSAPLDSATPTASSSPIFQHALTYGSPCREGGNPSSCWSRSSRRRSDHLGLRAPRAVARSAVAEPHGGTVRAGRAENGGTRLRPKLNSVPTLPERPALPLHDRVPRPGGAARPRARLRLRQRGRRP